MEFENQIICGDQIGIRTKTMSEHPILYTAEMPLNISSGYTTGYFNNQPFKG